RGRREKSSSGLSVISCGPRGGQGALGGGDGIFEQHRDRHRTHAAGYGGDAGSRAANALEIHVSGRFPSASRLMPTSTTIAPRLTISAVISFGLPAATTRISAWRVIEPRSGVLELQMVTVAPFCKSSNAMGLPTMLLRPTTTAWRPS